MKINIYAIVLVSINLIISSCKTPQFRDYPDFDQERLMVDNVCVLADIELIESKDKETSDIEKLNVKQLGQEIALLTSEHLSEKGYKISDVFEPTINALFHNRIKIKRGYTGTGTQTPRNTGRVSRKDRDIINNMNLIIDPSISDSSLIKIFPNWSEPAIRKKDYNDSSKINLLALIAIGKAPIRPTGLEGPVGMLSVFTLSFTPIYIFGVASKLSTPVTANLKIRVWLIDRGTKQVLFYGYKRFVGYELNQIRSNSIQSLESILSEISDRK